MEKNNWTELLERAVSELKRAHRKSLVQQIAYCEPAGGEAMNRATTAAKELAINSQVGRSLLAQIKGNIEWDGRTLEDAEAISMAINGCALEDVTIEQAYAMLREIHRISKPVEVQPHDGYCMTCERPSSLRQCMDCREGRSEVYRPRYHSIV
jgi:hypothetical protein